MKRETQQSQVQLIFNLKELNWTICHVQARLLITLQLLQLLTFVCHIFLETTTCSFDNTVQKQYQM